MTLAVLLAGCRDRNSTPTAPGVRAFDRPSAALTAPSTATWDTFVADVSISSSRVGSKPTIQAAIPARVFRLERSRAAGGTWRNVMTIDRSEVNRTLGSGGQRKRAATAVARIVDDGDGSGPKLFNEAGQEIRLPGPPSLPSSWRVDPAFQSAAAARGRASATGRRPAGTPHG